MKAAISPLKLALVAATALVLLSSCTPENDKTVVAPPPQDAPKVIRLISWSDYFDPEVLAGFEERTGIRIEYLTFGELDELEAKLRSQPGYYDVVVTDDQAISKLWELRLIDRLDHSLLPNLANIAPLFRGLPFDTNNEISAPYLWGTTLVAYRNDQITDPAPSWNLLWDENLKGRVMVMEDRLETLSVTLMSLGYSLNSEDPAEIDLATARAIEQIEKIDVRYGDDAEVRAGLEDGTLAAAMCYSGDAAMVAAENQFISFYIPREGAPLWIDNFAVIRDSNHPLEAHQLINYMLEAEVAAANSNHTCYASPNQAAIPFLDPELLADERINPPRDVLARCAFFTRATVTREDLTNRAWLKVQRLVNDRAAERNTEKSAEATR